MNKDIFASIINALKTITYILIQQEERRNSRRLLEDKIKESNIKFEEERFGYTQEGFNLIMESLMDEGSYLEYLKERNKKLKESIQSIKKTNEKLALELSELYLSSKDIIQRLDEVKFILENIDL